MTPGEDEIDIGQKLNIGAQQRLQTDILVFLYLLKLVDGDITTFARHLHVFKDLFEAFIPLTWLDIQCYGGYTREWVKSDSRPPCTEEILDFSEC